jgi:heparan-alpha-glucosaminide N-acetyltransferase
MVGLPIRARSISLDQPNGGGWPLTLIALKNPFWVIKGPTLQAKVYSSLRGPTCLRPCSRMMPVMGMREMPTYVSAAANAAVTGRIASIDIFRGLTVLVMVFVDNLDFVKGLPWWTYHMPRPSNGLTYVDMVFPAFLFVMGMSLPLAVERRLAIGDSRVRVWWHILGRALGLVALGLFIANGSQVDGQHTGISEVSWNLLGFAGIALFWGAYGSSLANKLPGRIVKLAGFLLLIVLAIIFRRVSPEGQVAWLDFSDWEILGLLGWAYLLVGSLYLVSKKNVAALAASLALLSALNVMSVANWFTWLKRWPPYAQPFEAGLSSITMAGLIAYLIILDDKFARDPRAKILWAVGYAVLLAAAAWLLTPFGISKLRDTPSWCLYCAAANTMLLLFLYWIADVRHRLKWAGFVKAVGSNALLAYMLAYVAYFSPTLFRLTADGTEGWYGVVRSLLFAALVFTLTIVLTRFKFRLQL